MSINNFKKFNESVYSMAAAIGPDMFKNPATNRDYTVKKVLITFPDTTKLVFDIKSESYGNDKINYVITNDNDNSNISLKDSYIKAFGSEIQMENYQEFVFVRCWNTPGDFIDNDWSGYIFNDSGFNEIDMKFEVQLEDGYKHFKNNSYSVDYYKNNLFLNAITNIKIVQQYNKDFPTGIRYKKLLRLKRKFQSWLVNDVNEYHNVDLFTAKVDNVSLISVIYALHLKDKSVFENLIGNGTYPFNRISYENLIDIKPAKILDLFYKS